MNSELIVQVLGWSMLVNFAVLAVWGLAMLAIPDFLCRTQAWFVPMTRDECMQAMYKLMGQYKIALLVTHLGPYIALRIVT